MSHSTIFLYFKGLGENIWRTCSLHKHCINDVYSIKKRTTTGFQFLFSRVVYQNILKHWRRSRSSLSHKCSQGFKLLPPFRVPPPFFVSLSISSLSHSYQAVVMINIYEDILTSITWSIAAWCNHQPIRKKTRAFNCYCRIIRV